MVQSREACRQTNRQTQRRIRIFISAKIPRLYNYGVVVEIFLL
jgi:hypothetical protein